MAVKLTLRAHCCGFHHLQSKNRQECALLMLLVIFEAATQQAAGSDCVQQSEGLAAASAPSRVQRKLLSPADDHTVDVVTKHASEQTCSRFNFSDKPTRNVTSQLANRRVFDCFLASHELDMMEIRMRELEAVVDAFVIVESRMTFRGRPKPLYLPRVVPKLPGSVLSKISYHVLDRLPGDSSWARETFQRNALLGPGLLRLHPQPGDVLMVSDCDEIPKPDFILALKHCVGVAYPLSMEALHHYYSFALKSNKVAKVWNKPDAMLYSNPLQLTAQQLRALPNKPVHHNSSWHCSTCFSHIALVLKKIASFSHSEFDLPEHTNPKNIITRVRNGLDLFNRPQMQFVRDDTGDMPEYIKQHPTRFSHLISRDSVDAGFKDMGTMPAEDSD